MREWGRFCGLIPFVIGLIPRVYLLNMANYCPRIPYCFYGFVGTGGGPAILMYVRPIGNHFFETREVQSRTRKLGIAWIGSLVVQS